MFYMSWRTKKSSGVIYPKGLRMREPKTFLGSEGLGTKLKINAVAQAISQIVLLRSHANPMWGRAKSTNSC